MLSSIDYAELAGIKITLGYLKAKEPDNKTVIEWIQNRIKNLEEKKNDTT